MKDISLYPMIARRKSIRRFDAGLTPSADELDAVQAHCKVLEPLLPEIRTEIAIVPREQTSALFGQYCTVLYSQPSPEAWLNCGYILAQLELWMVARDQGTCWYGMARPREKTLRDGLQYIILLAFGKSRPQDFRQNPAEARRKPAEDFLPAAFDARVKETVRLAPSATNSQPWRVASVGDELVVSRATRYLTYMPPRTRNYFNTIDMGIFLLTLELALIQYGYAIERTLADPAAKPMAGLVEIARYRVTPTLASSD